MVNRFKMKYRNMYSSLDYLCNEFSFTVNWLQSWVNDLIYRQEDTVQYLLQLNLALRWNVQFKLHRSVQVVTRFPAFILFINPTNLYILLFLYHFVFRAQYIYLFQYTNVVGYHFLHRRLPSVYKHCFPQQATHR